MSHERPTLVRGAALAVLGMRIGYAAGLLATPGRLGRPWLGAPAESAPTRVPLQGLGGRELVVHLAALRALLAGRPMRPWLAAGVAGDVTDVLATAAGRAGLPKGAPRKAALVAGGSAAVGAALWLAVGE